MYLNMRFKMWRGSREPWFTCPTPPFPKASNVLSLGRIRRVFRIHDICDVTPCSTGVKMGVFRTHQKPPLSRRSQFPENGRLWEGQFPLCRSTRGRVPSPCLRHPLWRVRSTREKSGVCEKVSAKQNECLLTCNNGIGIWKINKNMIKSRGHLNAVKVSHTKTLISTNERASGMLFAPNTP